MTTGNDHRRARALADPTRARVFDAVAASPDGVDVASLAAHAGVHHTAVRQHLHVLVAAGLVDEEIEAPHGRGRPRHLYRATDVGRSPEAAYLELARLLTRAVGTGRTPREVGRDAGRSVARAATATETPRAAGVTGSGAAVDTAQVIAGEARRLGFAPSVSEADGSVDIVLHACPFAQVAADDPKTVCSLHLGLAEGVAEVLGDARTVSLHANDPYTAGCRVTLRPARRRSASGTPG